MRPARSLLVLACVLGLTSVAGCGNDDTAAPTGTPTGTPTTPAATPTVVVTPTGDLRRACGAVARALPGNSFMQPSPTFAPRFARTLDALAASAEDAQTRDVLAALQTATQQVVAIYAGNGPDAEVDAGLVFQEAVTAFGDQCEAAGSSSF